MNIREKIEQASAGPPKTVPVPSWGIEVPLRKLDAEEKAGLLDQQGGRESVGDLYRYLIEVCRVTMTDEQGQPLFNGDTTQLAALDFDELSTVGLDICRRIGLSNKAVRADLDDAKKN